MQKIIPLMLCCLMLISIGCSKHPAAMQIENPRNQFQVMLHLETRNEVITILSGHEGRLYTVAAKDDRMPVLHLSEQEVQTKLPDIYRLLKKSYADSQRSDIVWAGD